jgi:hypothetical protein
LDLARFHCGSSSRGSRTSWAIAKTPQAVPANRLALGLAESLGIRLEALDLMPATPRGPTWIAQTRNQPFAILTMCRSLYVLAHGEVVSKGVAGRWAEQAIGQPWVESIEWALAWPRDADVDHTAAALGLIEYTLEQVRQPGRREK